MYCTIVSALVTLFILYALVGYIRRKITKADYTGKNVWITGASSGIGQYLAYQFNRCGANVIISARNIEELNRVKNTCPAPERA